MVPKNVFMTKGVGVHREKLQSFELALRHAGIEKQNLVRVSSIYPPKCKLISKEKGVKMLQPGGITFCVMAEAATNEASRLVAASLGLAVPASGEQYGYLSEFHGYGISQRKAGDYAEDLAATMLATTLGVDFDPEKAYDERKEIYRMSGKIVKTQNITQTSQGRPDGTWTTVLAVAVFIL